MQARVDPAPHLSFTWDAFFVLGSDRPIGFAGPGRIPFTAICAYADRYGIRDVDAFERFRHLVMAMDRTYIAHALERSGT